MQKLISFLVLAIALSGCVSTKVTRLQQDEYPSVNPEQVQIFMTEKDVKRPFEKIAIIHAEADANMSKRHKMIDAMQKKAAELGADGIILDAINEPAALEKIASQAVLATTDVYTKVERTGEAIAIRFLKQDK